MNFLSACIKHGISHAGNIIQHVQNFYATSKPFPLQRNTMSEPGLTIKQKVFGRGRPAYVKAAVLLVFLS